MRLDGAVGPILIAGVLSGGLALLAFGLRGARVYTGPGLALASIILSALPITFAMVITVVLRHEAEAEVWLSTSAIERELMRARGYVNADLVSFGRYATIPGLLLGALGWSNSTHRGSRAGGWMLAGVIGFAWLGSFAFELRAPPPARYPLANMPLWRIAIALETKNCDELASGLRSAPSVLPAELATWPTMAKSCVLEELRVLEQGPMSTSWVRQQQKLMFSPLLEEALRLRVDQVVAGRGDWPTVPAADEETIAKLKAQFAPVWPGVVECLAASGATEPIQLSLILRRSGIEEIRETSEPPHPAAVRCLAGMMAHLEVRSLTPVQADFTFSR